MAEANSLLCRWMLQRRHMTKSLWFSLNGGLLWLAFLLTRVLPAPYWFYELFRDPGLLESSAREHYALVLWWWWFLFM